MGGWAHHAAIVSGASTSLRISFGLGFHIAVIPSAVMGTYLGGEEGGFRSSATNSVTAAPELHEVVEPAGAVVPPEHEHGVLVDAGHVAEALVRCVAQSLHLEARNRHNTNNKKQKTRDTW